ncbi:unnamed protein product [Blepharisma stoltei]|uniref:Uncharacterized protein n=1 Tax=Blepharisma stoltei TaxID=1481888 RepID=A0AAU9J6G5_9CILI|nr:unnamed protein product [Blepharisma stoltei]
MKKLNEEDALLNRLLYKESPALRNFAIKCLELGHIVDFKNIHPSQSEKLLNDLKEGIKELEYIAEKRELSHYSYDADWNYLISQTDALQSKIDSYKQEIQALKEEYSHEKSLRSNLIEYEEEARAINKLPTCEEIDSAIEKIKHEIESTDKKILHYVDVMSQISSQSKSLFPTLETLQALNNQINS